MHKKTETDSDTGEGCGAQPFLPYAKLEQEW